MIMTLSTSTIKNLAHALIPEVIDYVTSDDRWTTFMMEIVDEAVADKLMTENTDLTTEISFYIIDNLQLNQYS